MANYNYNPDVDKPIFDVDGNKLTSIPHAPKKLIYNADGLKLSKVTLNIPQKSGFGTKENAKKINRIGRPKGSRTKTKNTLLDAISRFENYQLDAAELIVAVMMGDEVKVGGEIKVSDRIGAAKYVIEAPRKMDKPSTDEKSESLVEDEVEVIKPLISLTVSDR
jgi:hypothetical protein